MRRVVLLTLLVLVVSACKVKVEQGFELRADGSGEAITIIGFDQELQDMLSSAMPGGQDPFEQLATDVPPGWTADPWSQGDLKGVRATAAFTDLDGLRALVESDLSGEEGLFESFSIEEVDGGFRLDGVLSGESLEQGLELGDGFNFSAADETAAAFFEATIVVKLPGRVVSHNADELRGDGTLIWNVGLTDGGGILRAESRPGGGLNPLVLAGAAALVVVLLVAYLLWRRRPPTNPIGRLEYGDDGKPYLVAVSGDPFE